MVISACITRYTSSMNQHNKKASD